MVEHSPVVHIWLQIEVSLSIMASTPAWTNSAAMLFIPTHCSVFSAASTSSSGISGQSSTLDDLGQHQRHSCKGLSSTVLFLSVKGFRARH